MAATVAPEVELQIQNAQSTLLAKTNKQYMNKSEFVGFYLRWLNI